MAYLEKHIDWLTCGLCSVGCHADDVLNRFLEQFFMTEKPAGQMHHCILSLPVFMEPDYMNIDLMRQRKPYLEHRALLHHAIHADIATVELHDMLDD